MAVTLLAADARPGAAQGAAGAAAGDEACAAVVAVGDGAARDTSAAMRRPPRDTTGSVAIMLLASASAQEVRFARQPRIRVRLCGAVDSVRVLERRNLPQPVVAGRTYRDVYVAVEILGRINAACLVRRLGAADTSGVAGPCATLAIDGIAAPPSSSAPPP